jgi:hypothetical protein
MLAAAIGWLLLFGCSPKHPPFITDGTPGGAEGGKASSTGGATAGGTHTNVGGKTNSGGRAAVAGRGGAGGDDGAGGDGGSAGTGRGAEDPWVLDANEVYLWGTLEEGRADVDALANVNDGNRYLLGFHSASSSGASFLGNNLVYGQIDSMSMNRLFEPDLAWTGPFELSDYPSDPTRNDPIVPTPACTEGASGRGADFVRVSPEGRAIYQCGAPQSRAWYEDNQEVYSGVPLGLIAFGKGSLAIAHNYGIFLLDISAPEGAHELTDIVNEEITIRSHGDGFRIVEGDPANEKAATLWQVDPDGTTTKLGDYPATPPGTVPTNPHWAWGTGALTPDDALIQIASRPAMGEDVIIKRTLDGGSEIVYDEADEPAVLIHGSELVTGP